MSKSNAKPKYRPFRYETFIATVVTLVLAAATAWSWSFGSNAIGIVTFAICAALFCKMFNWQAISYKRRSQTNNTDDTEENHRQPRRSINEAAFEIARWLKATDISGIASKDLRKRAIKVKIKKDYLHFKSNDKAQLVKLTMQEYDKIIAA